MRKRSSLLSFLRYISRFLAGCFALWERQRIFTSWNSSITDTQFLALILFYLSHLACALIKCDCFCKNSICSLILRRSLLLSANTIFTLMFCPSRCSSGILKSFTWPWKEQKFLSLCSSTCPRPSRIFLQHRYPTFS
mgnify:CR=1 FL=1